MNKTNCLWKAWMILHLIYKNVREKEQKMDTKERKENKKGQNLCINGIM
jgi:hypothetical protein